MLTHRAVFCIVGHFNVAMQCSKSVWKENEIILMLNIKQICQDFYEVGSLKDWKLNEIITILKNLPRI